MKLPRRQISFHVAALLSAFLFVGITTADTGDPNAKAESGGTVSYYQQIRPILQAKCHGCHQPAKAKGDYVMTSFDRLSSGGESGEAAIVAGKPDESLLVEYITPIDGVAEMPKDAKPLAAAEIESIRRWVAEGAVDDTPASAKQRYDMDNPPVYMRPPVITSLEFSPDGQLLAVAGFHEVLLMKADGSELVARLVGLSDRIQSLRFSPDGSKLAVTAGRPARMGEVQVWDVNQRELLVSVPVTYDTVYGASWSPDNRVVAFGCADQTVRAIDAKTGEQVFFSGAHDDWALATTFSADGKHLVSVGRDMTTKLYEFAQQRFVDNVTSITPGALKGGILAVARHPQRDEIVIGGSDGVPKAYRMFRQTKRVIGDDANLIRVLPAMKGRVNSVAVSRNGSLIAAGSSLDGAGQVFVYAYNFDGTLPDNIKKIMQKPVRGRNAAEKKAIEQYRTKDNKVIGKTEFPEAAIYAVAFHPEGNTLAAAGSDGLVRLIDAADGTVKFTFSPAPVDPAASAVAEQKAADINFIRDVNPVLSRMGCNAGTCHGAAKGKNGFKLSLRGYDALNDVRALTDDHGSRRVNVASPDDSLMLLKAIAAVPHEGGQRMKPDEPYYRIIRDWITGGAELHLDVPRVAKIEITPGNPVLQKPSERQPMRVVATYTDGSTREVTREAFISSGNTEVATADRQGSLTAVRRGEAPVLARYEGAYAATTLTVMGDREEFRWEAPPTWGRVDQLVAAKWERMKIRPSGLCSDAEFIRRVYLDLAGLPPTTEQLQAFLQDPRETREKRDELVDQLIGSEDFIEYWTNKWADLLQVNGKFLGREGAVAFRQWIRAEVAGNTPYDQFARKILTAGGSNRENPAASYYKVLRDPVEIMENTTHLFLAIRFNCNKCHDHPFERWTQNQYYETAAYFARVGLKKDPASGKKTIGGTAVEGAKPLYEVVFDKPEGEVVHDRTKAVTPPEFPFECKFESADDAPRRQQLAAWITSPDNPYFARSYVNRLWGYLFGVGIIEPIDDIRAGNPATNPELLDYLTQQFIESGFNVRQMFALICKSRTYQLSFRTNRWNEDDRLNYSHALPRRLPAEVLYDTVHRVTGSVSKLPGVPPGTRAAALPDSGIKLPSGFLDTMGRPARQSSCECERSSGLELGPVMALISGPTVARVIADPNNELAKLVAETSDDTQLVNRLVMRILNRPATDVEVDATLKTLATIDNDHARLVDSLNRLQSQLAPTLAAEEAERQQRIDEARAQLAAYLQQNTARLAEQEKQRQQKIAQVQRALEDYQQRLPAKLARWEQQASTPITWSPLDPTQLAASNNAKLAKQPDLSILASRRNGKGTYTFVARSEMSGITGVKLELLSDERLPRKGPGRARNGNFVLSEFRVELAPEAEPQKKTPIQLQNAQADFSQNGYDVTTAIDKKKAPTNNGWATAPKTGQNRTAVFETAQNTGEGPVLLTFSLDQEYVDGQHSIGRFRISVTTSPRPVTLEALPKKISDILAIAADQRNDQQRQELLAYYRQIDGELKKHQQAVAEAKKPIPPDVVHQQHLQRVKDAERPIPLDPKLLALRKDVEISQQQLKNKRLTVAQDLTWALINSPAFLFNH